MRMGPGWIHWTECRERFAQKDAVAIWIALQRFGWNKKCRSFIDSRVKLASSIWQFNVNCCTTITFYLGSGDPWKSRCLTDSVHTWCIRSHAVEPVG